MRSTWCGLSFVAWIRSKFDASINPNRLNLVFTRLHVQYYCRHASATRRIKVEPQKSREVTGEFYVVRKGDLIGVYKSFNDCQKQLSLSVCDPAVSVYKGHSLLKETEEYLASFGLKGAIYSVNAVDVKFDLFGTLVPCPLQDVNENSPLPAESSHEHPNLVKDIKDPPQVSNNSLQSSCILEFDGASKGNPGKSGAGAIIRNEDGTMVYRLREGLGVTTCNVAEYRAMILGLKYALKKGFKQIRIQGDSILVCNQVNGVWRTRHRNLVDLYKEAKELRDKFVSFTLHHVKREFNSDADSEANSASSLPSGEIYEISESID